MTRFTPQPTNLLPSCWPDMATLEAAMHGSCSLPMFSAHWFGRFNQWRVVDGALSNYVPYFSDKARPQLVLRLSNLQSYSQWKTWSGMDSAPEDIFRQGQREVEQLLSQPDREFGGRIFLVEREAEVVQSWWAALRRNEVSPWVLNTYKAVLVLVLTNLMFPVLNLVTACVFGALGGLVLVVATIQAVGGWMLRDSPEHWGLGPQDASASQGKSS
eukprot:TRINITY_DN9206_c0_g1_i3.p1 TRINITY_DN9206_c0_g1~~TRINITY_DN9206_c0_g1_i3.p1  ORF type:complete len:215 (-),score=32.24 TRINITY_DN9206_c0_g1_i3:538-1182(-)